jgi:hypothetical protein
MINGILYCCTSSWNEAPDPSGLPELPFSGSAGTRGCFSSASFAVMAAAGLSAVAGGSLLLTGALLLSRGSQVHWLLERQSHRAKHGSGGLTRKIQSLAGSWQQKGQQQRDGRNCCCCCGTAQGRDLLLLLPGGVVDRVYLSRLLADRALEWPGASKLGGKKMEGTLGQTLSSAPLGSPRKELLRWIRVFWSRGRLTKPSHPGVLKRVPGRTIDRILIACTPRHSRRYTLHDMTWSEAGYFPFSTKIVPS